MKFETMTCPDCGKRAIGTLETVPGVAMFDESIDGPDESGEVEYDGFTDLNWNEGKSQRNSDGLILLTCGNGHEWPSKEVSHEILP